MAWLWTLLLFAAPARAAELPGRALFDAMGCRSCHSIGGVGGSAGPDLDLVGFRRGRAWLDLWLKDPKAWKRDTTMSNFRLKAAERSALVEYLSGLDKGFPAGLTGAQIYLKAGCVACHGARGRGKQPNNNVHGNEIPAVFKVADGYTLEELKTRIRSGRIPEPEDPSQPPPLVVMPAWGQVLKEADIEAVAQYLMTLAPPKKADDF